MSLKQIINADDWNEKRGMAKTNKEENLLLNNSLEQLRSSYVACYREMSLQKKVITIVTLKKEYFGNNDD